jgi:Mn2+/Fe2+ NRAMP family transporter
MKQKKVENMLQMVSNMKIRNIRNKYIRYICLFLKFFIAIYILNNILTLICGVALLLNFGIFNPAIIRIIITTIIPMIIIIFLLYKNISKKDKPMVCLCFFLIIYQILYEPSVKTDVFYDDKKSYMENFIESFKKTYSEPFEKYEHNY